MLVRWTGPRPGKALSLRLARAGISLAHRGSQGVVAQVVFSKSAAPPAAPLGDGLPWLWLSPRPLSAQAARAAALQGAYAALSLSEPRHAEELAARVAELAVKDPAPPDEREVVATSEASRRVLKRLWSAARTSMPVLLTGETGTGKDLAARQLHAWSPRTKAPFVPINCAAIPDHLIEAELFGYVRGAFSGAVRDHDGQLAAALGGTVFLDEIDDTPPTLQVKLLRVLEDHVVSRLGENVWRELDFRLVAATNRDLVEMIQRGIFGADLYERLAIVEINLPPLRERLEDLPALAKHLIARFYTEEPAARARCDVTAVSHQALAALVAYPWPGNVRELRNVIFEALVNKRAGDELLLADLPKRILTSKTRLEPQGGALFDRAALERRIDGGRMSLRDELEQLERHALEYALARSGGNASGAARLLGEVGRGSATDPGGTVRAMMRRLGVGRTARR